jgi:hypothetical protein
MSQNAQKRRGPVTKRKKRPDPLQQIVDAIQQAWPGGVVDIPENVDDGSLWDKYPKLKAGVSSIPGARVLYERELRVAGNLEEGSQSYWVFFLSPTDGGFEFETETVDPEDPDTERRYPGKGWMGCMVAISAVAPFAVVRLDDLEVFENGTRMDPDVEPHMYSMEMGKLDLDEHYREMVLDEGLSVLRNLEAGIVRVLEKSGIAVIAEEDLERQAPWLVAGDGLLRDADKPINMQDAFFFRWR